MKIMCKHCGYLTERNEDGDCYEGGGNSNGWTSRKEDKRPLPKTKEEVRRRIEEYLQ